MKDLIKWLQDCCTYDTGYLHSLKYDDKINKENTKKLFKILKEIK